MANPPKPWKVEYAKSGRSSCKSCKDTIGNEKLRIGKMVQSTHFDGFMPMWYHTSCIMKKANQIKSVDDVEGIESLRWEDQEKLRKYVESGPSSDTVSIRPTEFGIEISQTSRAICKCCSQKITKGEVRMSTKSFGQGMKGLAWHHAQCFMELSPSTVVENLNGWDSLPYSNREDVLSFALKVPTSSTVIKEEKQEGEDGLEKLATKGRGKRKKDFGDAPNLKACKMEDALTSGVVSNKENSNVQKKEPVDKSDLNNILEIQSKSIWTIKDDLKKNTTLSELREMLSINSQDSTGSEIDLRDRCADGMIFGALGHCPTCSGHISYSGGVYRCRGYLTAWSKCSYSTTQPERLKGKWNIPDETTNSYLLKWFKSQKVKKPARVLPPPSSRIHPEIKSSSLVALSQQNESIGELKVSFVGIHKESIEEWKLKIEGVGGLVHKKMSKETSCVVMSEDTVGDGESAEVKRAKRMKLPIVREDYLVDCFAKCKKLPFESYKIKQVGEEASSVVTIKVKGRSAVHESSGLQDNSHILEEGSSIYNTTLNLSDLSTGVNSYYILQIIQEDKGRDCYVFRKWGRVGNEKIGGNKLEELSQSEAIHEFKRLFLEKTGNTWEAWEGRDDFHKQPGRFFPLDIDYGVNKDAVNERNLNDSETQLSSPLLELMKMLFNKETYRSAMMEFQINMTEMPLGKLSKYNIQKGFEALTEIQNLFSSKSIDHSMKESLIVDASNRFFTVIPSINPHVIGNEDDLMAKIKMLDTLRDIEIASRLVGFDTDSNDTFDDKYKKLRCDILSLPHDSEDYKMIDMYLQSTHAPTHEDWNLELEEVFSLEREGEIDKYAPCREKLQNKMLLWHGSRLTNFVGILSEGLRIAPPEAPATGYMFGKGIYFADLVSKSAQYCYSSRDSPVGLMLLSEVALGQIHELKKAKYMEKPPKGKQSTKGVGKMKPRESEQVVWREDVVVPCGTPIPSDVKTSELMYNEYIVYNTDQVKLQFLLKVRFHHKK